eukprot:7130126-Prymnesium_polylepis.1
MRRGSQVSGRWGRRGKRRREDGGAAGRAGARGEQWKKPLVRVSGRSGRHVGLSDLVYGNRA